VLSRTQRSSFFSQFDQRGIDLGASNFITIEAMELSRPDLYTSQGDVTAVTAGHVQFQVHPGFPDPVKLMEAPLAVGSERTLVHFRGNALDPELAPNAEKTSLSGMKALGSGTYDAMLQNSTQVADLKIGDQVALKSKVGDKTVFAVDCNDFTVQDVIISRHSAVPIAVDGACERTVIQRVVIPRDPPINGRTPFFSGAGGGPQLTTKSVGPTVQDCVITGTTDDAIALDAYDMSALPSGAILRNNIIRDSQGRWINITQSLNGIVSDNTITRTVNASIQIRLTSKANGHPGAAVKGWTESRDTLARGWSDAVIWLNKENQSTGGDGERHTDIAIEGNIFLLAPKHNPMIHVENSNDIRIDDNTIVSFSPEEDVPVAGVPQPPPLVYVQDGLNVHGALSARRPGFSATKLAQFTNTYAILILEGRDASPITLRMGRDRRRLPYSAAARGCAVARAVSAAPSTPSRRRSCSRSSSPSRRRGRRGAPPSPARRCCR
jgi:hypothetical protein